MPATLNLTDMKQIINKNPDTAQEAFEGKITEAYKNGTINIEEYKEGIKRLDFIFDVLSVRKSIYGDNKGSQGNLKYLGEFGKVKKLIIRLTISKLNSSNLKLVYNSVDVIYYFDN